MRSPAAWTRSCASRLATRPAGRLCCAARTAIRGASGVTGSSPMCSSMTRGPPERVDVDTAVEAKAVERVGERLARNAVERRATGYTAQAIRSAPARAASSAPASAFPAEPWL